MRRLAYFTTVCLIAGIAPALGADIRTKAPIEAAVPVTDPFTGFSIGVNGGYGFDLGQFGAGPASIADLAGSPQGFVGGVQATLGARFQQFLYAGIEGDIDGATVNGTGSMPGLITANSKNTYLASIRGRFGVIMNSDMLLYGTVGYGFGGGQFRITDVVNGVNSTVNPTMSGVVWGGGVEYALTSRWLARVEYLQYDFGSFTTAMPATMPGILFTQKDRVDVIRAGLSLKLF